MTIQDIKSLIQDDETRTLEVKKTTGELCDGLRSACAMLNTAGGWLLFGIAPTSLNILGQQVTDNTRREIGQFNSPGGSVGIAIYDDRVEIENSGHLPEELTIETIIQSHQSYPHNPIIADVLFKTTFLENWGSGVGRILEACQEAGLPQPEYGQNASFVWITFKRPTENTNDPPTLQSQQPTTSADTKALSTNAFTASTHPQAPTTSPDNDPTTPQPLKPTTSAARSKLKRLRTLLAIIGDKGSNIKAIMEQMHLKDRKSFVRTYIDPCLTAGYIAMLYPETPNHPMQSYYLTQQGREALMQFVMEQL